MPKLDLGLFLNFGAPQRIFAGRFGQAGAGAWIVGPQTSFRLNEALGLRAFMVVRLTAVGAHLILRLPMHSIVDRVVELDDFDRGFASELVGRARSATSWPERFATVEAVLTHRIQNEQAPRLVMRATALIEAAQGALNLARLAADLNCSHSHLVAQFRERIGLTPKTVARIVRFDSTLAAICRERRIEHPIGAPHLDLERGRSQSKSGRAINWADLALTHGYYDQAHFSNEFHALSGIRPSQFLASL